MKERENRYSSVVRFPITAGILPDKRLAEADLKYNYFHSLKIKDSNNYIQIGHTKREAEVAYTNTSLVDAHSLGMVPVR
ncbi:hypothetical protein HanLR1_Chr16g0629251 [Helianthus annuus]|nr:hypothetical protein HanLR1_Chr16g0629251 [Helianthus annuus]